MALPAPSPDPFDCILLGPWKLFWGSSWASPRVWSMCTSQRAVAGIFEPHTTHPGLHNTAGWKSAWAWRGSENAALDLRMLLQIWEWCLRSIKDATGLPEILGRMENDIWACKRKYLFLKTFLAGYVGAILMRLFYCVPCVIVRSWSCYGRIAHIACSTSSFCQLGSPLLGRQVQRRAGTFWREEVFIYISNVK